MCRLDYSTPYNRSDAPVPSESFIQYILAWAINETLNDEPFWQQLKEEELRVSP